MIELGLSVAASSAVLGSWIHRTRQHRQLVDDLDVRIHVNGIRGKSSVARLVSAILRHDGYTTIAKTTGSAAVVIDQKGNDHPIVRTGPATILEQLEIARKWVLPDVNALVIECMAIDPGYQQVCEEQIVRSQIGVITNIREDHQDVMGYTLADIARSMLNTCPSNGVLITAEQNPDLLPILEETTRRRNTRLIIVDPADVDPNDMTGFPYIEFEDNVAVGLAIADELGISHKEAMLAMWNASPDPGVLRIIDNKIERVYVTWANMFAINDRESVIAVMERVLRYSKPTTAVVTILNNRTDREQRALQFADIASFDIETDYIVTFGAFEKTVTKRLVSNGFNPKRIINLGDESNKSWEDIIQEMILGPGTEHVLLAGMVNIHTRQAKQLTGFLEGPIH